MLQMFRYLETRESREAEEAKPRAKALSVSLSSGRSERFLRVQKGIALHTHSASIDHIRSS